MTANTELAVSNIGYLFFITSTYIPPALFLHILPVRN